MEQTSPINFSIGNPRLSFKAAARFACDITDEEMKSYAPNPQEYISRYLADTCGFFREMRLQRPGFAEVGLDSLAITHGTTQGYESCLKVILSRFKKFRQLNENEELKPVIIIPLPTYGFFLEQPKELGMEIVHIKREIQNSWKLNPDEIAKTLKDIRASEDRVAVAFFDSNPNNPTGLVRSAEETQILTDIFCKHNEIMHERVSVQGDACGQDLTSISVIDDMVYYGLEYEPNNKAISFMTDGRMYDRTYVLLGTSKIGLPSLRGGLVVCNTIDANIIRYIVAKNCYSPSISAMKAVQYAFSAMEGETRERDSHLQKLREAHVYGELLLRSLVRGIPCTELKTPSGERLLEDVAAVVQSMDQAKHILMSGIKELELVTQPQSGFFHLAKLREGVDLEYRGEKIQDDKILEMFLTDNGVAVCPGRWCGMDEKDNLMRLSYGLAPKDIVRCAVRIRAAFESARL